MNRQETTVMLKCDCCCSMLVVNKAVWDDGEVNYDISVQDSHYDHNYTTLWGRLKTATKILLGKDVKTSICKEYRQACCLLKRVLFLLCMEIWYASYLGSP